MRDEGTVGTLGTVRAEGTLGHVGIVRAEGTLRDVGTVRAIGTLKLGLLWLRRKARYGCALWTKNADLLITLICCFLVRKVRAIIRDVDWLCPMLGRKMGGRSLLPTWFMGDIIYGKNQLSVRQLFHFSH